MSKCGGNSDKDSDIEEFVPEASAEILKELSLQEEVPEVPSPGMVLTESGDIDPSLLSAENSMIEGKYIKNLTFCVNVLNYVCVYAFFIGIVVA